MKNIYHKIISSALIAACVLLLTCGDFETDNPGMVWIPPGTFTMGSPLSDPDRFTFDHGGGVVDDVEKEHQVTLSKGFWMSRYEITQEQFYSIMGDRPSGFVGERLPVENLSWYQVIVFCNKLSFKEGLTPVYRMTNNFAKNSTDPAIWIASSPAGKIPDKNSDSTIIAKWDAVEMIGWPDKIPNGYRLPTEAEWEYACRAGTTTAFHWGSNQITDKQANFDASVYPYNGSLSGEFRKKTISVGTFSPNKWGLYDMHGNVWEWCWDWYDRAYDLSTQPQHDPKGSPSGDHRVVRGGSWQNYGQYLRSACRHGDPTIDSVGGEVNKYIGFRVVRQ